MGIYVCTLSFSLLNRLHSVHSTCTTISSVVFFSTLRCSLSSSSSKQQQKQKITKKSETWRAMMTTVQYDFNDEVLNSLLTRSFNSNQSWCVVVLGGAMALRYYNQLLLLELIMRNTDTQFESETSAVIELKRLTSRVL